MPRGGARAGAGRPPIAEEGCAYETRAISKTVTLPAESWEWLISHSDDGSASTAIKALISMVRSPKPNGVKIPGWRW